MGNILRSPEQEGSSVNHSKLRLLSLNINMSQYIKILPSRLVINKWLQSSLNSRVLASLTLAECRLDLDRAVGTYCLTLPLEIGLSCSSKLSYFTNTTQIQVYKSQHISLTGEDYSYTLQGCSYESTTKQKSQTIIFIIVEIKRYNIHEIDYLRTTIHM